MRMSVQGPPGVLSVLEIRADKRTYLFQNHRGGRLKAPHHVQDLYPASVEYWIPKTVQVAVEVKGCRIEDGG